MKHETYQLLKQAYMGHVDKPALLQSVLQEKDPFLQRAIQLVTSETPPFPIPWNPQVFTTEFRKGDPKERLEETVMTFLLRLVAIIKEEMLVRTFRSPESHAAIHAWINLLKFSLQSVLSLLFNVHWQVSHSVQLETLVFELIHGGSPSALRRFMENTLHLQLVTSSTMAEQMAESLNLLNIGQFGSSFWRLLHWMAEAMDMRSDSEMSHPKRLWKELVVGPLYRMLRCGMCMSHMRQLTRELRDQLMDPNTNYRQLWFNMHNEVHAIKKEYYSSLGIRLSTDPYSESELEQDAAFMSQALVP